jgi:hypothetical protein
VLGLGETRIIFDGVVGVIGGRDRGRERYGQEQNGSGVSAHPARIDTIARELRDFFTAASSMISVEKAIQGGLADPLVAVVRAVWHGPHPMQTNENVTTTNSSGTSTAARFTELQALVAGMAADFQKFYVDGNKAAGTRVRLAMQELKTFAQTVRTEVQAIKNGGKADATDSSDDSAEA